METKQSDLYRRVRGTVDRFLDRHDISQQAWTGALLATPDLVYLIVRLMRDSRVPLKEKAKLAGAVAYFLSPVELLSEAVIGPVGLVDDIALAAFALHSVINHVDPAIVREHWTGKEDVLETIQRILNRASETLGTGVFGKMRKRFGRAG